MKGYAENFYQNKIEEAGLEEALLKYREKIITGTLDEEEIEKLLDSISKIVEYIISKTLKTIYYISENKMCKDILETVEKAQFIYWINRISRMLLLNLCDCKKKVCSRSHNIISWLDSDLKRQELWAFLLRAVRGSAFSQEKEQKKKSPFPWFKSLKSGMLFPFLKDWSLKFDIVPIIINICKCKRKYKGDICPECYMRFDKRMMKKSICDSIVNIMNIIKNNINKKLYKCSKSECGNYFYSYKNDSIKQKSKCPLVLCNSVRSQRPTTAFEVYYSKLNLISLDQPDNHEKDKLEKEHIDNKENQYIELAELFKYEYLCEIVDHKWFWLKLLCFSKDKLLDESEMWIIIKGEWKPDDDICDNLLSIINGRTNPKYTSRDIEHHLNKYKLKLEISGNETTKNDNEIKMSLIEISERVKKIIKSIYA